MSLKKRIKGDYTIETINDGNDNTITLRALGGNSKVVIDGDLTVLGTQTSVNSTDTNIVDNTIVLNSGEIGAGVGEGFSGIVVDRGTLADAGLRFNELTDTWEIDNGSGTWSPILTSSSGSGLQNIVEDTTPQLGGDLDVNGFLITSAANGDVTIVANGTGLVKIDQELSLKEQLTDETPVPGYNKLYAKSVGAGGTGIYFSNLSETGEMISKKKAIVYSIIF